MGKQQNPVYSEEFKRDAVRLVTSSGRTRAEVARELGISGETLRTWVRAFAAEGEAAGGSDLSADERAELRELRRKVKQQDEVISIPKKSHCLLRERPPVEAVYRFVGAEKAHHAVTLLCGVLGVSRNAYYDWVAAAAARLARVRAEELLVAEIVLIHLGSRGAYGSPRVHAELVRRGHRVNRKRVERLMRDHSIAGFTRRRGRRCLTKQDHAARFAPDLIGRDFTARAPGERLVGDVTCIPTGEGFLYLAGWVDLATKEVIGWSMGEHHDGALVGAALEMARARGRLRPGCVVHSDRGGEYTGSGFRGLIARCGYRQSMGRTGSCYDNAVAESHWALIKTEIGVREWPDRASARAALFEYIEVFYNRKRLRKYPGWGYLTPLEARQRYGQVLNLAA
ncbi:IS3 family transposase [Actinospica robiniae]|uniref:IS3 family transposase n=1 Tax=Actinospica robiniae TaxID=304901 RepID=UPI00146FA777|nr:IS3 family transposase [Actinospica robiniae]